MNAFYLRFSKKVGRSCRKCLFFCARLEGKASRSRPPCARSGRGSTARTWGASISRQLRWQAEMEERCYEWYFPETEGARGAEGAPCRGRLHLKLEDASEDEARGCRVVALRQDLWISLRQLTGLENLEAAKARWSMFESV